MSTESYFPTESENIEDIDRRVEARELAPKDQRLIEWATRSLEDPLRQVLGQLKESIQNGDYKVLVGEDASGRLPTFVMHKVLSAVYQEKGYPPVATRYLSGNRGNSWLDVIFQKKKSQLKEYLADLNEFLGTEMQSGKILIVTDHIETGKSLLLLTKLLNEAGIDYDIATVAIDSEDVHRQLEDKWGHEIVAGRTTNAMVSGLKDFSGVYKDNPNIHARRLQPGDKEYYDHGELERELYDEHTQERINESRKKMGELAEKLTSEIFPSESVPEI